MAGLDSLTDSQRAILQLLLKRSKSYEQIDAMLKLQAGAAQSRAHDAIDAIGPSRTEIGDARCHEIADYLLDQQTETVRAATNEYLSDSAPGRRWARAVADALRPIAAGELPWIPPDPVEVPPPAALAPPPPQRPAAAGRDSQLATRLLFGALGLAVAIAVIVVTGVFRDDDKTTTSTVTRTASTTPSDSPQTISQGMLTAPGGGDATADTGIIRYPQTNNFKLLVAAKNLKPPRSGTAYGIWLYTSESEKLFLGFPRATVSDAGTLDVVADLTPETPNFDEVLVTRETTEEPTSPGEIILRGKLAVTTSSQGTATQAQTQTQPG
ncbi:MAG: anti-sigma factor [Solirubrobacteraceae bacterium]